ncbi:hypothetical protein AYI69_g8596 [Smittium culicis]|uniref:LITAF domain-containing protein n=1 Tax=Smittium culicis TaxID=133412 RepID=A0A1R1XIK9_9FUNG|nr:hypothetical protein AYI69_g8596 [Smittium culicis]
MKLTKAYNEDNDFPEKRSQLSQIPVYETVPAYANSTVGADQLLRPNSSQFPQPSPNPNLSDFNHGPVIQKFKGVPVNITCPNCKCAITTKIVYKPGSKTIAAVVITTLVFFPLFWVPLITDTLKDKKQTCPYCKIDFGDSIYIDASTL